MPYRLHSKAKITAPFMNARLAVPLRVLLEEIGHKPPATEIIEDNNAAEGILNGKIKENISKGIYMRYD